MYQKKTHIFLLCFAQRRTFWTWYEKQRDVKEKIATTDYETLEIVGTARKETVNKNKGQKARCGGGIFATHNIHMGLIQLIYTKLSAVSGKKTDNATGKLAKVTNNQLTETQSHWQVYTWKTILVHINKEIWNETI